MWHTDWSPIILETFIWEPGLIPVQMCPWCQLLCIKLCSNDPKIQKPAPSSLQVGTYTTDTVKIVRSCKFYLVHLDTKKLMEVTFYVAMNDGSVLLSCKTTLLLGLIQPRSRLDYLPPRASPITSSADHPKKTKVVLNVQNKKCPLKQLCKKWLSKHQQPEQKN